ncbi:MAG: hypothetical protein OXL37_00110, partial [Chloroflexota bacterium]|nr:hypothetical protein [Chloroflexota bacterium]
LKSPQPIPVYPVHPCKRDNMPLTALPNLRVLEVASLMPGPCCGKLRAPYATAIKANLPVLPG